MNRRSFFLAAGAVALSVNHVNASPFKVRHMKTGGVTPPPTVPTVGPHASWNGTAGSGAAAPTDPVRVTAKPALRWYSPSQDVITGAYVIGCFADAAGGIASVNLSGDCASTTITTATLYTDTDANGVIRTRYGYWWSLTSSAFTAISAAGTANLYATATANDGTMQTRTIGGPPLLTANDARTDMQVYPRTAQYDWSKTIGSGGDYATWDAMTVGLAAAQGGGGAKRPHVTFITTATYTMTNGGATDCTGHEAYCVADAGVGITATIKCGSSFDPTRTTNNWTWHLGVAQVHFKGAGIKIDRQYFNAIAHPGIRPFWFDGITFTNGIGTDNTYYWNGDETGNFLVASNGSGSSSFPYVNDCACSYAEINCGASIYNGNTSYRPGVGRIFNSPMRMGNYTYGATCEWWRPQPFAALMTISYSGAATTAVAKLYSQTAAGGNPKIELIENGSIAHTITIVNDGVYTAGQNMKPSELAATISSFTGWSTSAVAADASSLWCRFLDGSETGAPTSLDCKAGPKIATVQSSIHSEWSQFSGYENIAMWFNILRACFYSSAQQFTDSNLDESWGNNIFDPIGSNVFTAGSMNFPNCKHLMLRNNIFGQSMVNTGNSDAYSIAVQNVILGTPGNVGATWPWTNNVTIGTITGALSSGNQVVADEAAFTALFMNRATGDYRPAVASALLGWKDTPSSPYDAFFNTRATTDVRGSVAAAAPAHTYPF